MSSPFRRSDTLRTTPRSSPSRQRLGDSRNGLSNGHHHATSEGITDSPTQQLQNEFNRLLLDEHRHLADRLDTNDAEQKRLHREALDAAREKHEAIWQSAERARETLELNIRLDRLKREDEEKRTAEKARRELAEKEIEQQRRQLEVAKREEEERNQREAVRREQEAQKRRAEAQKQREEQEAAEVRAAAEKEEADRKAREEAAALERQQQAQKPAPVPAPLQQPPNGNGSAAQSAPGTALQQQRPPAPSEPQPAPQIQPVAQPTGRAQIIKSGNEEREEIHRRYVDLWKRLKIMRKSIEMQCKKAGFKELGNWRREAASRLSQLHRGDTDGNKVALKRIRVVLDQAAAMTEPSVDPRPFIIYPAQPPTSENANPQYPGILLYLLSMLAKAAIKQLTEMASMHPNAADPIGVLLSTIFSIQDYRWNGQSMIDVVWAKYHIVCPPVFGLFGSEKTVSGRERIGWKPDYTSDKYYARMNGLGAGFSALTLRDYSKNRNKNPVPNRMWWESIARILNLPEGEAQAMHYVLVKTMIEEYVPRILQIFASAGKAALHKAVREYPYISPKSNGIMIASAVALETLQLTLHQRYGLTL